MTDHLLDAERAYLDALIAETDDLVHRALRAGDPAQAEHYEVRRICARQRLTEIAAAKARWT
jgi:hypothetical protein